MKNFILIHLESLSELIFRTNWQLFSNINKIMEESVYFPNYFSSATSTLMVISDICYGGMYREKCTKLENDYRDLGNHTSLFDELVDIGYKTKGVIWPELTTYSKIVNGCILGKNIEVIVAQSYDDFLKEIENNIKSTSPFALFIGNFSSHVSYRNGRGSDSYTRWKEGYKQIDDTCGKVFNFLKKADKEKDTIVVLYGDHGDDYWGHRFHDGYTHAIEPYSSLIHTPLIIWDNCQKRIDTNLISSIDLKSKIGRMIKGNQKEEHRRFIFSRNIFANQKADYMTLSKGYAVANGEYILLTSIRGLELYNIKMDPANVCNLLEFFDMDSAGKIMFSPKFKKNQSMHFSDFFTDREIRHLRSVYIQLRKVLLNETENIYKMIDKSIEDRDKELNFARINRYHLYKYNKIFSNKWISKKIHQITIRKIFTRKIK